MEVQVSKTIQIIVAPDGKAVVETRGFVGPSCQDASRFIEQALGERTSEERSPEFYHVPSVEQPQQQQA